MLQPDDRADPETCFVRGVVYAMLRNAVARGASSELLLLRHQGPTKQQQAT
jgi:hypothetical protein